MAETKEERTKAASQKIQAAGVMSKVIADQFLERHPDAVPLVLDNPTAVDLRDVLATFVWKNDPEAQKAYREALAKESGEPYIDEPDTDVVLDEDVTNG